ncbi:MAG TPA: hypothetical protein VMU81_09920 [Acetobacteraceae bacterium]|nr:hypothetical protein [Acetobacteraceae bacterium]
MQRCKTLTGSDIRVIENEARTLPGRWQVDPVIDLKRPGRPRVWVRDVAGVMPSINFERIGNAIWASSQDEGEYDALFAISAAFVTVPAAFVYIGGHLASVSQAGAAAPRPSAPPMSPAGKDHKRRRRGWSHADSARNDAGLRPALS